MIMTGRTINDESTNVRSRVWNQAKALPSSASPNPSTCVCRSLTCFAQMAFLKGAT